ncbi:MAG: protein O-mannosyl-transferase [Solirubrobacteraceae bacterium]|jgi:hypothetical protein|nr:protein O-mannosyl-transferase [Solirubrobacteraceae bacterium]
MRSRLGRGGVALALGCGLLGALLYVPAASSGRLADDWVLLRTVRRVTDLAWPFTHNDLGQPSGSGHFYRPLWVLWNRAVYDLSHSPAFAHILNLALFAIVCAEVVLLVRRIAGTRAAVLAGVTVAVFPSHGESVAWISGNTDVLAVALALAAILVAMPARPSIARDVAIAALTALAALAKEIAVVLPVLTAVLLWVNAAGSPALRRPGYWRAVYVMLATVLVVLIPRAVVIGGVGGYGGQTVTPVRVGGALASFILGGLSAPQLALLQHPVLLLVPACVLVLLTAGLWRAWLARSSVTARLAIAGGAWFLVALILVLNQPLNLNTRNGDRLLLLPSVGLAIAIGALIARSRRKAVLAAWGVVAVLCAVSCVLSALDWRTAGTESRRLLVEIDRIAPPHAHLVALSLPTDYRAAHLYPDALDLAVRESGRPDISFIGCMPVQALSLRRHQVSFVALPLGLWFGNTTSRAPFEVPVLGSSAPQSSSACRFGKAPDQPHETLGTALRALVSPNPAVTGGAIPIYFDGRDMRRAP